MNLSDLTLEKWESREFLAAWGQDDPNLQRRFYAHHGKFYKVWGERFHVPGYILVNGAFENHKFSEATSGIAAIDVGLIRRDTCRAFVDLIWDDNALCRGYVLEEGTLCESFDEVDPAFVESVCRRSLQSGYASTDFCPNNVVRLGSGFSLIDIDSVPTRLDRLNLDFERVSGCLRPHMFPAYRDFILANCNRNFKSSSAVVARTPA